MIELEGRIINLAHVVEICPGADSGTVIVDREGTEHYYSANYEELCNHLCKLGLVFRII